MSISNKRLPQVNFCQASCPFSRVLVIKILSGSQISGSVESLRTQANTRRLCISQTVLQEEESDGRCTAAG